ncbi:hypothetical protein B0H10DRAFT_2123931 [Mycena sp. CBHHK59/15]|nr:hypothetical protein B0H10DRAFT_2123931 [Mycena sp. CBHHK59/15]
MANPPGSNHSYPQVNNYYNTTGGNITNVAGQQYMYNNVYAGEINNVSGNFTKYNSPATVNVGVQPPPGPSPRFNNGAAPPPSREANRETWARSSARPAPYRVPRPTPEQGDNRPQSYYSGNNHGEAADPSHSGSASSASAKPVGRRPSPPPPRLYRSRRYKHRPVYPPAPPLATQNSSGRKSSIHGEDADAQTNDETQDSAVSVEPEEHGGSAA